MFGYEEIILKKENGENFFYQKRKIKKLLEEIEELIKQNPILEKYDAAEKELKKSTNKVKERNLQDAFSYIKEKSNLSEKTLKELYDRINKGLLSDDTIKSMGQLYRNEEVYITSSKMDISSLINADKGVSKDKIEECMNSLFQFSESKEDSREEAFIKSQIIHFYFVYVHPFSDSNGRCARVLGVQYLKNHNASPYTSFYEGIKNHRREYKEAIQKSKKGNLTPFLELMARLVKIELKKELIIQNVDLPQKERDTLNYILSTNHQTLREVREMFMEHERIPEQNKVIERIIPLLEKGIIRIEYDRIVLNESKQIIKNRE